MKDKWIEVINKIGFPASVCIYLLWERHNSLMEITATMNELVQKIEVLIQTAGG